MYKRQVREVIQGFDRLLDRDAKQEAALYLEDWLARYEEAGDWASQITILNEMMGFYLSLIHIWPYHGGVFP